MKIKEDIRNLSLKELEEYLVSINEPLFRGKQIFDWIYQKGIGSFDQMRNIPKSFCSELSNNFCISRAVVSDQQISSDGTAKFLFELNDGERIETVLIPTASRITVCVTSQSGCKFGCRFCASGIGGWKRNLSVAEILDQILYVKEKAKEYERTLSHIVFMGTGENFDTYDNLMKAIRIINTKEGLNIGARRITISTVGIIPRMKDLAQENIQVELAISLHGYNEKSRNILMPINKKYSFTDLMKACRDYIQTTNRQITFEYILIKGVTCTQKAVGELAKHFKGMTCKMNLIPYNPVGEFSHKTPSREEMYKFRDLLIQSGIHSTIRMPRGKDINGACGQLRHSKKEEKK